jgi:hypothetical protein
MNISPSVDVMLAERDAYTPTPVISPGALTVPFCTSSPVAPA